MTDSDVPRGEMPHLPIRRRKGDSAEPPQLDELLGAGAAAPAVSADWRPVSELLRAASGPATASEFEGEAAIVAAFRGAQVGVAARRRVARRPRMLATVLSGKIAAAIACAAIGVTGATGAAFAGVLPNPIQKFAHATIGAPESDVVGVAADHHSTAPEASGSTSPEPSHSDSHSASPEPRKSLTASERARHAAASASASATASAAADARAAAGLCHTWSQSLTPGAQNHAAEQDQHGVLDQAAQRAKLVALAGGADKIAAFCATVKHENRSASPFAAPSATSVPGDGVLDGKPGTHGAGPNNNSLFGNSGFGNGFSANNSGHPNGGGHK